MKRILFSSYRLSVAIQAFVLTFTFAAIAGLANAAPSASAQYTINGSTVTGSGSNPTSAVFYDPTTTTPYTITITVGSNLGNTTNAGGQGNEIDFITGSVNNAGTLSATDAGIYIDGGNGSVVNTGSISGSNQGGVESFIDSDGTTGMSNSFSLINSATGSITSSADYGVDIDVLANQNSTGTSANSNILTISNAGTISADGGYAIYLNFAENEDNAGVTNANTITIANSGMLTANNHGIYLDNVENEDNTGSGASMNTIAVTTTGSVISGHDGIILQNIINNENAGSTNANNITISISGSLSASNYGILLENVVNNDNAGVTNANTVTISNSGTLIANTAPGIYLQSIENENNTGSGANTNTVVVTNTGSVSSIQGAGIGLFSVENEDNSGNGANANSVTLVNNGVINAENDGMSAGAINQGNTGTGLNSNTITFANGGVITSSNGDGIQLENENVGAKGNASNSIGIVNSGAISALDTAIYVVNSNVTTTGNSVQSISVANSGASSSSVGDGVYLVNSEAGTSGSSTNTITVVNSSTGSMIGGANAYGLYINNATTGVSATENIFNAGTISAGLEGINLRAYYGNVMTVGGTISGLGEYAIELNGDHDSVTVVGRTLVQGVIYGDGFAHNSLTLDLAGLTPAQLAADQAAVATGTGTVYAAGYVYNFADFPTAGSVVFHGVSFEQSVDSGLQPLAIKLDTVSLPPGALDLIYSQGFSNPEATLNKLVGREINQGLDTFGVNINTTFNSNLNEHLDNLLTGGQLGGIDLGGMHVSEAGSMYAMADTTTQLESITHMIGTSTFGGTEISTDTKATVATQSPPAWGLWASGNVTLGDETGANTLSGFHSTLGSPTLGLDYRVTPSLVFGLVGSYTTGDANFDDGSSIGVNTELLALYGTWRSGNWHVNGIAGGGLSQFNDTRTTFGGTADSTPRGYDILTDWTAGYDFHLGDRWNITPEVGLQYTHLGIDSFTESGAGVFDLAEGNQDIDSLRSHVGFRVDKAYSLGKDLTFTPELHAQWYHEFMDDSRGISTSLPGAPALGSFSVSTFSPQRDFALVGVGLNTAFTGYKGVPIGLFINYDAQVGQSNYIANSVNAGIRVDF